MEKASGDGEWKERVETTSGKSELTRGPCHSPSPLAVSTRRLHSPSPFAVSIRRLHSPSPFAVSIRRLHSPSPFAASILLTAQSAAPKTNAPRHERSASTIPPAQRATPLQAPAGQPRHAARGRPRSCCRCTAAYADGARSAGCRAHAARRRMRLRRPAPR